MGQRKGENNEKQLNNEKEENNEEEMNNGKQVGNIVNNFDVKDVKQFEDILEIVGTQGKKHIFILFCCVWASVVSPLHTVSYQFLGAIPTHWCEPSVLKNNDWSSTEIRNISLPENDKSGKGEYCEMKNYNYSEIITFGKSFISNPDNSSLDDNNPLINCQKRTFNSSAPITVSIEWDLVCERKWIYSFTQTAVMIGKLLGSLTLGYLLDMMGRKKVLVWASPSYIIIGLITAASPNVWMYVICKVFSSALGMAFYMGGLVLAMEICSINQRSYVGPFSALPWAIGYMLTPGIAYVVKPWRWLQVAITLPAFTHIASLWVIPESPRWLMTKGRYEESYEVLVKIAENNQKKMPSKEDMINALKKLNQNESNEETSFKTKIYDSAMKLSAIVRIREYRVRSFACFFCWFSVSLVYYGISLNSTNLSTDKYLYTFLGGLLEIPAYLVMAPVIAKIGRTKTLVATYYICAVCLFTVMTLILADKEIPEVMLLISLVGKFAITVAFQLIWMFTAELFPTEYRSIALGESSVCARFGSGISPFINDILGANESNRWTPSFLFAVLSFLAGTIGAVLPETNNKVLQDTAQKRDPENIEINQSYQNNDNPAFQSNE